MGEPQKLTVFVGQLGYRTKENEIRKHFQGPGFEGSVKVRMLTKSGTNEFRGFAFVEFENQADYERALTKDYSVLNGRRLRVERTLSGGGENRKRGLDRLRKKDQTRKKEMIDQHVKEAFRKAEKTELTVEDLDDQVMEFLVSIPVEVATAVVDELLEVSFTKAKHRKRYLMGIIKRKLREHGEEIEVPAQGRGKRKAEQTNNTEEEDREASRIITVARSYEDGEWHEATILRELSEEKYLIRFTHTEREQEVLREDLKTRTKRKQREDTGNNSSKRRRGSRGGSGRRSGSRK